MISMFKFTQLNPRRLQRKITFRIYAYYILLPYILRFFNYYLCFFTSKKIANLFYILYVNKNFLFFSVKYINL